MLRSCPVRVARGRVGWLRARAHAACLVLGVSLAIAILGLSGAALAEAGRAPRETVVVGLNVLPGVARASIEIVSVGKLAPQVYQIAGPDRLVIDAPGVGFRLPSRLAADGAGLVRDVRYGQLAQGRARIVAEVGPGIRVAAVVNERLQGQLHRIRIDLTSGLERSGEVVRAAIGGAGALGGAAGDQADGEAEPSSRPGARPVVMIDPGHGGIDPGAVVNRTQLEKMIVLDVSLKVARLLEEAGQVDVVLTRKSDVFLTLDERIERARAARADLFLSLHADAVDDGTPALAVGGASVYILSRRASDAVARRLAEKENAADRFAGILPKRAADDGVRTILVDLLKRETETESKRLRNVLVTEMRQKVAMAQNPMRSAAFHVLKQTETPAALIELGFMTNPVDLGLMRQEEWRNSMAGAIARALHRYFRERP
jgi:N-acetylmuramoyl-L-alanine amidase